MRTLLKVMTLGFFGITGTVVSSNCHFSMASTLV